MGKKLQPFNVIRSTPHSRERIGFDEEGKRYMEAEEEEGERMRVFVSGGNMQIFFVVEPRRSVTCSQRLRS